MHLLPTGSVDLCQEDVGGVEGEAAAGLGILRLLWPQLALSLHQMSSWSRDRCPPIPAHLAAVEVLEHAAGPAGVLGQLAAEAGGAPLLLHHVYVGAAAGGQEQWQQQQRGHGASRAFSTQSFTVSCVSS